MTTDTAFINSQIDIREAAENAGAEFHGNRATCPIHGGDNPHAFEIFDGGRAWTCHTRTECNQFGHDGIGLLRALNNWTFNEVKERYTTAIDPQEAARRAAENAKRIERELQEKIEQAQRAIEELRKARKWVEDHDPGRADVGTSGNTSKLARLLVSWLSSRLWLFIQWATLYISNFDDPIIRGQRR
jgi:hypothetical protein